MLNYLNRKRKKGQSTLEYAILVIIIIGALLSLQVYIKRGVGGRLKSAADDIGDQYSDGNMNVIKVMHTGSQTRDTFKTGKSRSQLLKNENTTENTNSQVLNTVSEYWG
jgi:hypothetical protein